MTEEIQTAAANPDSQVPAPPEAVGMAGEKQLAVDADAQDLLIASLRSQIQDLFSQVTQLNGKLVTSYDRVSDLEDELHITSTNLRSSAVKLTELELERTQHLSALNTGLLVEKSHVTAELTRLMEKATEEAAQRGQAETARADIEKELDDLSASLFSQANTMVAEARLARARSERKAEELEEALKAAEEVNGVMQQQMQTMKSEKEDVEKGAEQIQAAMGKGKWVERSATNGDPVQALRLLSSHQPYQEFLLFIAHLRSIHPSSSQPPAISTLLPLPALARMVMEDSDPTVRLDLAPALNWLSRRSILSAIYSGQLTVEPVSTLTLLHESVTSNSASTIVAGINGTTTNIACALCGAPIFPSSDDHSQSRGMTRRNSNGTTLWSTSLFKKPLSYAQSGITYDSPPPTPPLASTRVLAPHPAHHPQQIYVFRITPSASSLTTASTVNLSLSSSQHSTSIGPSTSSHYPSPPLHPTRGATHQQNRSSVSTTSTTLYPLCASGWCLGRLRTTCSLWAFVRTGVIDKVWQEEIPMPNTTLVSATLTETDIVKEADSAKSAPPPTPPKRRGLWGMASALSERAVSWSEGDRLAKAKEKEKQISPPPLKQSVATDATDAPPTTTSIPSALSGPTFTPLPNGDSHQSTTSSRPSIAPTPNTAMDTDAFDVPHVNGHSDTSKITIVAVDMNSPSTVTASATRPPAPPLPHRPSGPRSRTPTRKPVPTHAGHSLLSRSVSSIEEFTTPPEESESSVMLPPSESETLPASIVALPTSSSNTPTEPAFGTQGTPQDSAALSGEEPSDSVPPSSSLPPPPLPRRAAARPRGNTPTQGTSPLSDALAANAHGSDEAQEIQPELATSAVQEVDSAQRAEEGNDEAADQPLPSGVSGKEVEADSVVDAPAPSVVDAPAPSIMSVSVYSPTSHTTVLESEPSMLNGVVSSMGKVEEYKPAAKDGERDGETYVGDATWEERTWKELVKIKEEMFLARIGALR